MGFLVAVETDVAHFGNGNQALQPFHHTQAGPENRDNGQFAAADGLGHGLANRGFNLDIGEREVTQDLITHQESDFFEQFAEILGTGFLHSHDGQLVLNHRMVDNVQLAHGGVVFVFLFIQQSPTLCRTLCYVVGMTRLERATPTSRT